MEKETLIKANKIQSTIECYKETRKEVEKVQQLIMIVGRNMSIGSVMDDEDWQFIETHRKLVDDYLKLFNRGFLKLIRDSEKEIERL